MILEDFMRQVHETAFSKGWWDDINPGDDAELRIPEKIALMHEELSEALGEYRNHNIREIYFTKGEGDVEKPEGLPVELADCIIRILDTAAYFGLPVIEAMEAKAIYNKTRSYRHGGKKA